MAKKRIEIELIDFALKLLKDNPNSSLSHSEYIQMEPSIRSDWFCEFKQEFKICSICPDMVCNLHLNEYPLIPCPEGRGEVIKITEDDRIQYKFDINKLLTSFKDLIKSDIDQIREVNGIYFLGTVKHQNDQWEIAFSFSRRIEKSFGNTFLDLYKLSSPFTLLIVEEVPTLDDFQLSLFEQSGIYIKRWDDTKKNTIKTIYEEYPSEIQLRNDLLKMDIKNKSSEMISALRLAATTADGDGFEEEVFSICRWLFQTVVPFGGQYKGFAVPDGLITDTSDKPLHVLFYDCKSFKVDEFVHKPGTAMQVNYYQDFLNDFFNSGNYDNAGFIIFSSSFPDEVQKTITGSAQWKFVQEKCKLFFINVQSLEKVDKLIKEFGANFNTRTVFDICFNDKISQINEHEVESYYAKLFPASAYSSFRFLSADQFEFAIIAGFIEEEDRIQEEGLSGLGYRLKKMLRSAKHEQLNKHVKSPTIFPLLRRVIENIKEKGKIEFLHPLSSLLILKRFEEEIMSSSNEKTFNTLLKSTITQINGLIETS